MPHFPLFIDLKDRPCLIVGGGRVACRKVEKLLPYGPDITLVAPEFCPELAEMEGISLLRRSYCDADIHGMALVIAATDDTELNRRISAACREQNIPVNVSNPMPQRPVAPMFTQAPAYQLPCERGLLKMLLLGILTGGIYPLVIYSRISMEINMVASRYDGQRTMHFLWMCFLAPLTLMIYPFVWIHNLCNRMGGELHRRQINYRFSAASYWLWTLVYGMVGGMVTGIVAYVLFTIVQLQQIMVLLICSALMLASMVGPLVFIHKMMKAMNLINADYNRRG